MNRAAPPRSEFKTSRTAFSGKKANRSARRPAEPVTSTQCLAWQPAVERAEGDVSRVRVSTVNVAYVVNSPNAPIPGEGRKRGKRH